MPQKIRVGVIFGGRSAEHEVSLVSAASVINALDKEKYEILPIGITPEGRWLSTHEALRLLKEKHSVDNIPEHILVPDPRKRGLVLLHKSSASEASHRVDVFFPVLHGTYGEDGTIQGLFELADVPYVGAGVLGSAVGMDKVVQKHLLQQAKIPVARGIWFLFSEFESHRKKIIIHIEQKLRYPCFVKPANMGSSVGISKAHNKTELIDAIFLAGEFDRKILVEKGIEQAREIECSVLGNDDPSASLPGEIIPSNEFYDYDAKYVDGKSAAIIPAKLLKSVTKKIQEYAVSAFKALSCEGMARVDFLVTKKTNKIFLNEINTIPGFTSISMYPKLWQASGLSYSALLDKLIELAIERHEAKKKLKTSYTPKKDWYRG
ncbi:MAG: D-alanine--D-alanine ligase [Ignavibacteriales bacterium]|nr:D-alanine--D-alanine ligase [Ignavibacteriales bacterium]